MDARHGGSRGRQPHGTTIRRASPVTRHSRTPSLGPHCERRWPSKRCPNRNADSSRTSSNVSSYGGRSIRSIQIKPEDCPKTSESRGTEAVLNALILASRDARSGTLTADARQAFDNLWSLQFRNGDLKGAWAWLNFHNEPWEGNGSAYFGAALAAIAVGTAPGEYSANQDIQDRLTLLRGYLQRGADTVSLFNRMMALWASGGIQSMLTKEQRQSIVDAAFAKQQSDGGWSTSTLGPWTRSDGTPVDAASDGFATGLAALALQRAGVSRRDSRLQRGLDWLAQHQDATTGAWFASSVNKKRDPATDVGKFMIDAATAFAVLALTQTP